MSSRTSIGIDLRCARLYKTSMTEKAVFSSLVLNIEFIAFLRYPFQSNNFPLSESLYKYERSISSHLGCMVFHVPSPD
jgi:hypothetical protein